GGADVRPSASLFATLALVAALPARVAAFPAILVIRPVLVVRVAWITTLGAVADALVALILVVVVMALAAVAIMIAVIIIVLIAVAIALAAVRAAGDRGAGSRHVADSHSSSVSFGSRPRVPVQGATGRGDSRPGQDVALKDRSRSRRGIDCGGLGDPPVHIACLGAVGQEHGEVGSREGARAGGAGAPDLEQPGRVGIASRVEGQRDIRRRQCRTGAVDTGGQARAGRDRTQQGMREVAVAYLGRERVVLGEEGIESRNRGCVPDMRRPRKATDQGDRAGGGGLEGADGPGDAPVGAAYCRLAEYREARRRATTAATTVAPLVVCEQGGVGWSVGIGATRRGQQGGEGCDDGQTRRASRQSRHGSSQRLV